MTPPTIELVSVVAVLVAAVLGLVLRRRPLLYLAAFVVGFLTVNPASPPSRSRIRVVIVDAPVSDGANLPESVEDLLDDPSYAGIVNPRRDHTR